MQCHLGLCQSCWQAGVGYQIGMCLCLERGSLGALADFGEKDDWKLLTPFVLTKTFLDDTV
jgi:hypothetical protein